MELEGGVSQSVDTGGEQRSGEGKGETLENEDWVWAGETKAATLGQTKRDIKGGGRIGRDIRGGVEVSRLYPIKAGFSTERGFSLMDRQRTVCVGGLQ